MSKNKIILGEILNPEVYAGIVERDFHLYVLKSIHPSRKTPESVYIEPESKPKCSCQM